MELILPLIVAVLTALWQWRDARATSRKLDEANRRLDNLREMVKKALAGIPRDEALPLMTRMLPRSEEEVRDAIERHDGDMVAAIGELWDEFEEEMERDYYEQAAMDAWADQQRG